MNGAQLLVATAIRSGVEVCFANPGTTELPIVAALDAVPGIRPVLCLFEGVCAGAADGYGRMLRKPAMTLFHLGPGLGYGLANLHNARRAKTPVFNVVGEHATWHRHADPPLAMDIEALAGTVSGWTRTFGSPQSISQDTVDAIEAAALGQVATLVIPHDLQWTEGLEQPIGIAHPDFDPADTNKVTTAANSLRSYQKVALILGGRALSRRGLMAAARIRQAADCHLLSETLPARMERGLGIPAVDRIPYFPEKAVALLSHFEAIVLAGAASPVAFFGYKGSPSLLLDGSQIVTSVAVGNESVEEALEQLADLVGGSSAREPEARVPRQLDRVNLPHGALSPQKVSAVLAALQPEEAIVVDESVTGGAGYYALAAASLPHTLLTLTGGALGQGMPCAVGAAVACPDRPVINIEADGSAMYTIQALWTEARESLNVTTLVCSNRRYEILRVEMERSGDTPLGPSALSLTDIGRPPIDWTKIAAGAGAPATSVNTAEELAVELKNALSEPGPHLIEMIL